MTRALLRSLFAYDAWANRAAAESFGAAEALPPRAQAILGHLVGAGRLWQDRLLGVPSSIAVWPDLTPAQCDAAFREMEATWAAYLGTLRERDLDRRISYTNTKGEHWENSIRDILLHVTIHGSYHRGQIATLLRQAGAAPAYTDYIEAVRRGLLRR